MTNDNSNRGCGVDITDINQEIIVRLKEDFGGKIDSSQKYWQEGRCPNCGKKSLWTLVEKPLTPMCNRLNKCGYEMSTREQYPDLFTNITERYPQTSKNPKATADKYLALMRGLDPNKSIGEYTQEAYQNPYANKATATIRFEIDQGVFWEKFCDKVSVRKEDGSVVERDSNFIGQYGGKVWKGKNFLPEVGTRVYLTEGIFDALALRENGLNAVSLMACKNYPEQLINEYKDADITWVLALDHDDAGLPSALAHIEKLEAANQKWSIILPSMFKSGLDWNDLHKANKLSKEDLKRYEYYGQLAVAKTAEEYALLRWNFSASRFFVFEFKHQMYSFEYDPDKFEKALIQYREGKEMEEASVVPDDERHKIMQGVCEVRNWANCAIKFAYTQKHPGTGEILYFYKVTFPDGRSGSGTMTSSQWVSASDFRKRLPSIASGALMSANPDIHEWWIRKDSQNILEVDTIAYAGYYPTVDAWVFPNFAIKNGRFFKVNSDEFIRLDKKTAVKSAYHNIEIEPNRERQDYDPTWIEDLYTAWGVKGVIALAYFTISLFAVQIRNRQKALVFLEMVGEAGTGKSTIIEFLWRLLGRSYEGLDPSASGEVFISRSLAQVSNLPVVFIEGDRSDTGDKRRAHQAEFNWEAIKKLSDGRAPRGRGVATSGNETYEPPFQGSLVIAQNVPLDASEAVLSRLAQVYFKQDDCSNQTLEAAKRISARDMNKVSGYLIQVLEKSNEMLDVFFKRQAKAEEYILSQHWSRMPRIATNHAQLAAAVECLSLVTPIRKEIIKDTKQHLLLMAQERENAVKRAHPIEQQFFQIIDYLDERGIRLNHSKSDDTLCFRLNEVQEMSREYNQTFPEMVTLQKILRSSRRLIQSNASVSSALEKKTVKCWKFKLSE